MGSVLLNLPSNQIDRYSTMLGGANADSVYSRTSQSTPSAQSAPASSRSRSSSVNSTGTPTSTTAPPASGSGSTRLPALPNDVLPAYIQSQTPSLPSSRSTPSHPPSRPPPSMTSHSHYGIPPDHPSHSNSHTPQYPHHSQMGHHAATASITSAPNPHPQASPDSPRLQPTFRSMQSLGGSEANSPSRIRVRSLSHIQSLASEEFLHQSHRSHLPGHGSQPRQFEISSMPVTDIIEMVAGLLTKITTTNDMHHEHVHRHIPPPDGTSNLSPQATSVLAFHGKNVPSITILSYLTRIHKYCPTTYEVFLSLLVYFDRMTELVNRDQLGHGQHHYTSTPGELSSSTSTESLVTDSRHREQDSSMVTPPSSTRMTGQDPSPNSTISPALYPQGEDDNLSHFFVVDSFNIHRLVIAGVTCASKFFSDVFYTNSRYAKVGGLPLVELNHLELQFLMLNDFRLAIPVEELESYGTMLVEFYAREIVAQQQQQHQSVPRPINPASDSAADAMYMRSRDKRQDQPDFGQTPTPP
ncbi:Putative PHO85 cyclin-7 [Penicillium brasilianum]|uniref:Putative PHO85 cyclin-7 n=1 Tax=Penicillium brasilianum TaxID=104259 RepID=A0A0F7VFJ1_PENBI|nr:Putative PHO85 cyclin-7 [Penicillium brasilianum]